MASGNKKSGTKTSSNKKTTGKTSTKSKARKSLGSSAGKRTGTKTTSTPRMTKKQKAAELARQRQMRNEIILIVIFAFSIFLLIANFRICGIVGDVVSGFFFGILGFSEYFFPIYFFVSAAFLISNDFNRKLVKRVVCFGVVLLLVSMIFQVFYSTDYISIKNCYMDGYQHHAGGGVIGGGIFFAIRKLLGVPGACIVMFILAVVMFILITEISVIDNIKILWEKIRYERSDDYDKRYDHDDEYTDYEGDRERYNLVTEDEDRESVSAGRRAKPSMANLNVYKTKVNTDKNKTEYNPSDGGKNKNEKPKDFFYREDVHELQSDDLFSDRTASPYDEFSNDVEKIVMSDEEEYINPVQVDRGTDDNLDRRTVHNRRNSGRMETVKTLEEPEKIISDTVAASAVMDKTMIRKDIPDGDSEDILAGAINGNMHPESISDYNPLMDSAFAEDTTGSNTKKPTKRNIQSNTDAKTYQEGHRYRFPTASLLNQPPKNNNSNRDAHVRETAIKLKNTLETFGVNVTITNYSCGPAVTRFEMQPEQGVKVSKILNLADDIKLNLAAADIRIEAPIPGKAAIGIEVPNKENSIVAFRELIESDNFKNLKTKVAFAVGKDISGQVIATDIAKMPHLLIAGATGSGKSVCINTLIMSILYKATPEEVKLIMIDPKMVELACYNGIPHLLIPVVTDPKKAAGALNWAVVEMTRRYQLFAEHSVRNIQGYNDKVENAIIAGADGEKLSKMPQIVVIVDELADLMMVAHGEVEDAIVRLSQLARAAGIHLVIATQRPSVDVITGLIKANVPSRIAFAVSSGVDSRTILDMVGAEKLLGKGDMLFYPTGYPKPVRVQGAFVSDDEVTAVVDFLKKNNGVGTYDDDVAKSISGNGGSGATAIGGASASDKDEYFVEAGRFIIEKEKASIGMLQRTFKIGFNRAARIMDQLMAAGVVGPEEGTKARKILMSQEQFDEYIDNNL